jgi:hypothetical protein
MSCSYRTRAKRRYVWSSFGIMLCYLGLALSSRMMVNRWTPRAWHLYLAAALPSVPVIIYAYVVGRYLRDETDEYERDIVIRGMLWGTAATLSLTVFIGFLRSFGWHGELPPFTEFIVFTLTTAIAQSVHRLRDWVSQND